MRTGAIIAAITAAGCCVFIAAQLIRLLLFKRGTWWAVPFGIGGCATALGLAIMLDALDREAKFGPLSVTNGEAASLGEIGAIGGVCLVVFTALVRLGWLNRKLF